MRVLAPVLSAALLIAPAAAQYSTDFEGLTGSAAGTVLTGQDGYYLPGGTMSVDFNVHTYAGNTLGVVANPNGGTQFIAGTGPASPTFARAQRDLTYGGGTGFWTIGFDVCALYTGVLPSAQNLGSVSVQPFPGSQSFIALATWTDPTTATNWNADYVWFDGAGTQLTESVVDPGFQNLAVNTWYRWETDVNLDTNQVVEVRLTDIGAGTTVKNNPADRYMLGGTASSVTPTGFRFFGGGGVAGNTLAFDNADIGEYSPTCIAAPGAAIAVAQDSITGPNPIGFAFPFDGGTYSDIHISDHGICFLSNAGVPATPAPTPLVYTPSASSIVANGPVICPLWSDTIPGVGGEFFIEATATVCTVTWVDVESFGITDPKMTFQLKLYVTGNIEFIYGPTVTNNSTFGGVSDNGIVGVSPGSPAILPASSDMSTSPVTTDPTFFEQFVAAGDFDMANGTLLLVPSGLGGYSATYTLCGAGCASIDAYGVGCDGLTLEGTVPVLGSNWDLTTTGIHASSPMCFTYLAFGQEMPAVPLSSLGFNAPGCDLNIVLGSTVGILAGTVTAGSCTVTVPVTATTAFICLPVDVQSAALTPNIPAGFATSNGFRGRYGQ